MPSGENVQRRYFELRFDDDRTVMGTAIRYGDVATFPYGPQERFEPGAFGDLRGADVMLTMMHDRSKPVARSGGGGLELRDSSVELAVSARLADTREADDALALIRQKVLRGLSVEFVPKRTKMQGNTVVVERAELRAVSIVDKPQYKQSKIRGDDMDEAAIAKVAEAVAKRMETPPAPDMKALATEVATQMRAQVDEAVTKAFEARDAEAKKRQEEEAAAKRTEEEVERRAEVVLLAKPLLPEGTETRGKSVKDILVLAVGDEVPEAEKRSEDYLQAKVEDIVERRSHGGGNRKGVESRMDDPGDLLHPISVLNLPPPAVRSEA